MRLVKLPLAQWNDTGPAYILVNPDSVAAVVPDHPTEDGQPTTWVWVGHSAHEVRLTEAEVLQSLGATVTEVVFRDVTPG